eukprot:TRINITY_DN18102_c0_g1_i2.p1 TRINITY_DN18102_c0_g1~~TRINITY_DN18102_c0_g1_i2.p1  ORF type:complete len:462 (-),score=55.86 TRINITY_DN18102_c0_g1_i2:1299-2684(-)
MQEPGCALGVTWGVSRSQSKRLSGWKSTTLVALLLSCSFLASGSLRDASKQASGDVVGAGLLWSFLSCLASLAPDLRWASAAIQRGPSTLASGRSLAAEENASLEDIIMQDKDLDEEGLRQALLEMRATLASAKSVAAAHDWLHRPAALEAREWLERELGKDNDGDMRIRDWLEQGVGNGTDDLLDLEDDLTTSPPPSTSTFQIVDDVDPSVVPLWGMTARIGSRPGPEPFDLPEHKGQKTFKKKYLGFRTAVRFERSLTQFDQRKISAVIAAPAKLAREAICGGNIIEATMFGAEMGLQIFGAVEQCANQATEAQKSACTRDLGISMRCAARTVRSGIRAHRGCAGAGLQCGDAIADWFSRATYMLEYAGRMALVCRPNLFLTGSSLVCGQRLNAISWQLPAFVGDLSTASRVCVPNPPAKSKPKIDYATCVGEILSLTGYVTASGLELASTRQKAYTAH